MQQNSSKKKPKKKPQPDKCPYCGDKNVETIYVKHAGVMRICKNCREEF
jgi:hypothetical protein